MAKKVNPLTNTQVKQAKPKDKIYKLSDGDGLQFWNHNLLDTIDRFLQKIVKNVKQKFSLILDNLY